MYTYPHRDVHGGLWKSSPAQHALTASGSQSHSYSFKVIVKALSSGWTRREGGLGSSSVGRYTRDGDSVNGSKTVQLSLGEDSALEESGTVSV